MFMMEAKSLRCLLDLNFLFINRTWRSPTLRKKFWFLGQNISHRCEHHIDLVLVFMYELMEVSSVQWKMKFADTGSEVM